MKSKAPERVLENRHPERAIKSCAAEGTFASLQSPANYPPRTKKFLVNSAALWLAYVVSGLIFAACATPTLTPPLFPTTAPTTTAIPLTATPSATASPSPTVTETPLFISIADAIANPNVTYVAPELYVAVPTINPENPLRFSFPTPIIFPTPLNWRPPVVDVPIARHPYDHFWFARPVASDNVNWPLGSYRYGSNYFGQMNIHAGIDIDAPLDTPILASAPGTVVWAGWGLFTFDPTNIEDPYGIAVAIRHDFGYDGEPLYTLYAHMAAENNLYVGQRVQTGEVLGWIGVTGNTTGPHVHFEVRQGKNGYFDTRNPELWLAPYSNWGVLAGQVLNRSGSFINNVAVLIENERGQTLYTIYTYGSRVANPDDQWHENFAIADLPAGRYNLRFIIPEGVIRVTDDLSTTTELLSDSLVITGSVEVVPGQTNFVRVQMIGEDEVGVKPIFVSNVIPTPQGLPPYPTNTYTPSPTITLTFTPSPTNTRRPSQTPTVTRTPRPSATLTPTRTPRPSATATRTP